MMTGGTAMISKMTLKDKIALCEGTNCWETTEFPQYGIPSMFMCDGPHGLRKQENHNDHLGVHKSRPATCFPAAVTSACSWDLELIGEIGSAIAEEAVDQGVGIFLGPGVNISAIHCVDGILSIFPKILTLPGKWQLLSLKWHKKMVLVPALSTLLQ